MRFFLRPHSFLTFTSIGLWASAQAADFTVTNTNDSGAGSLRAAMTGAASTPAADRIVFNISPAGLRTINLLTTLPFQNYPLTIDGSTQPGFVAGGAPVIEINASAVTPGAPLIELNGGSSSVLNVTVNGFYGETQIGIWLGGSSGNSVRGCQIGTNAAGTASAAAGLGIVVYQSTNATIGGDAAGQGNLLSGCTNGAGVRVYNSTGCVIAGNKIGSNPGGNDAVPNALGVLLDGNSSGTIVRNNLISGNTQNGLLIFGADGTKVTGNKIGTTANGLSAIGNGLATYGAGVVVAPASPTDAATGTVIGGTTAGTENLISGNDSGIIIDGAGSSTTIQGNKIGSDLSGSLAIGNIQSGIFVTNGAANCVIGGSGAAGNLFSGNDYAGILIAGTGTNNTRIEGNKIGTNSTGTAANANDVGCLISGANTGTKLVNNLISANQSDGVMILGADGVIFEGNFIGTTANGEAALGNADTGIFISTTTDLNPSTACKIGGSTTAVRNLISGNGVGVLIGGPGSDGNIISGNRIGTNATGLAPLPNDSWGISIGLGASDTLIGGTGTSGNLISGNGGAGIYLSDSTTLRTVIQGNVIGLDANGEATLFPESSFNSITGILLDDGVGDTVIGLNSSLAGAGNIIAGNLGDGIILSGAKNTTILGNSIGTNAAGTIEAGNYGTGISCVADDDGRIPSGLVGNGTAGGGNQIQYNSASGVYVREGELSIRRNSFHRNGYLGINIATNDENYDLVSANDSLDSDDGGNHGQNFPEISGAVISGANVIVSGSISTTPNTSVIIDLYGNPVMDPSQFGEGKIWVSSTTVTTNPAGFAAWSISSPGTRGQVYSATATAANASSEFSRSYDFSNGLVEFSEGYPSVSESAGTYTFTLQRSGKLDTAFVASIEARDDSALSPGDYVLASNTVAFAVNQTSATGTVTIKNNSTAAADKRFLLHLTGGTNNAAVGPTAGQIVTILDDETPPVITITEELTVTEGDSGSDNANLTGTLDRPYSQNLSIGIRTYDYTAVAGEDFTSIDTTVVVPAGATSFSVPLAILGDLRSEDDKMFYVLFSRPGGEAFSFSGSSTALVTISDNDPQPLLTVGSLTVIEPSQAVFRLQLSAASGREITINANTLGGSATAGSDFIEKTSTVFFAPGETEKSFPVTILADGIEEADETFTLALTTGSKVTLPAANPTATIIPLKLQNFTADGDSLSFSYRSGTGQTAAVYHSSDLVQWHAIPASVAVGDGTTQQISLSKTDYPAPHFFRVKLEP